jgi:hypothetical protein
MINNDTIKYETLPKDSEIEFQIPIETDYLNYSNYVYIKLLANDLYQFNNDLVCYLYVFEDTEPPTLKVLFDGNEINKIGYIRFNPSIDIILNDNSYLVVGNNPINVRLNGIPLSSSSDNVKD